MCPIIEDIPLFKAQLEFEFLTVCMLYKWPTHKILFVDGWLTVDGKRIKEVDVYEIYVNAKGYYAIDCEAEVCTHLLDIIEKETDIIPLSPEETDKRIEYYTNYTQE